MRFTLALGGLVFAGPLALGSALAGLPLPAGLLSLACLVLALIAAKEFPR